MQLHQKIITRLADRFSELARKVSGTAAGSLEQRLLDRTRELAALESVALTLGQAGNIEEMLDKSLSKIFNSVPGLESRGGVFLCEADDGCLRLTVQQGLDPEFARCGAAISAADCLCGKVAQSGELAYSEKNCVESFYATCPVNGSHPHIIVPIKARDVVLGVFVLFTNKGFSLNPSDLQMLEMIGLQLGLAIENLRFYAEVKDASEKYWDLFENSRDILFTVDPIGRLTAVNNAAENFLGYPKIELIGKNVLYFLTRESAQVATRLLGGNPPRIIELEVAKRDGSRAFLDVSVRKLLKARTNVGFQISARDMTTQKKMREKLVQAERLGAIGQVGIAMRHQINNPLTTVIGNIELLLERYDKKDPDLTERLDIILDNALRIAKVIERVEKIKQEKIVEYLRGVKMTDLIQE